MEHDDDTNSVQRQRDRSHNDIITDLEYDYMTWLEAHAKRGARSERMRQPPMTCLKSERVFGDKPKMTKRGLTSLPPNETA